MSTPTITQLQRAIGISEQIETLQKELAAIFGGSGGEVVAVSKAKPKTKGKRTMSPEARERIAAAQRARWAKSKAGKAPAETKKEAKSAPVKVAKKRKISPESRAKMAEAAKRRWATQKAAK